MFKYLSGNGLLSRVVNGLTVAALCSGMLLAGTAARADRAQCMRDCQAILDSSLNLNESTAANCNRDCYVVASGLGLAGLAYLPFCLNGCDQVKADSDNLAADRALQCVHGCPPDPSE